jgi:hypothetical protein
VIAISGR